MMQRGSKASRRGDTKRVDEDERRCKVTSNHFALKVDSRAAALVRHRITLEPLGDAAARTIPDRYKATVIEAYLQSVAPGATAYDRDFLVIATKDMTAESDFGFNDRTYRITLEKQTSFDLQHLLTTRDATLAQEPLQALDVVMASAARTVCETFGRRGVWLHKERCTALFPNDGPAAVTLFQGHSQRVHLTNKAGQGKNREQVLSISFDARGDVGVRRLPVIEYLKARCKIDVKQKAVWSEEDRVAAGEALGNLEVSFVHRSGCGFLSSEVIAESAAEFRFPFGEEGESISVAEYLLATYKISLQFPNTPLIKLKRRRDVIPLELLIIKTQRLINVPPAATVACQRLMTMKPSLRYAEVVKARNLLASVPLLEKFGISIDATPVASQAFVLRSPTLTYDKVEIVTTRGAWNMKDNKFPPESRPLTWGVVSCVAKEMESIIADWAQNFARFGQETLNIKCNKPSRVLHARPFDSDDSGCLSLVTKLIAEKNTRPDFVLVVKSGVDENDYKEIKRHFDRHGVVTQCVVQENTPGINPRLQPAPDHWANIWAKIQVKCGRDCQLLTQAAKLKKICDWETTVLGADLCHPMLKLKAPHDRAHLPSYGSLVRSLNQALTVFTCSSRIHLGGTDELDQMEHMITSVMSKAPQWPKKIIYLRDGISDGQIATTMTNEIRMILKAYEAAGRPAPLITAISVRKRHHTRLFLANPEAERNVESGTMCFESLAPASDLPNFFLVSQQGALGTSRPTKYQFLRDDIGLKNEYMKKLDLDKKSLLYGHSIYELCHLHGHCQKAVSLPSPVTWAHKLAERMRITGEEIARQRLESPEPLGRKECDTFVEEMNRIAHNIESVMTKMYWI